MTEEITVTIGTDHPSLQGHFPGNPIVPGVVLLGEVMKAIRQVEQVPLNVGGFQSVKFISPLFPDESLTIRLEPYDNGMRAFTCHSQTHPIASGSVTYSPIKTPSTRTP